MKKQLFISYANENLNKVNLITKELENHSTFKSLVVANNRERNKALIKKVTDGIKSSYKVIALLTKESIKEQWINQEIGYAFGKKVEVIPIIEKELLDNDILKGFIHKQNDCPYTFLTGPNIKMREENKAFMACFRILIDDLAEELNPKDSVSEIKSTIDVNSSIDPVSNAVTKHFPESSSLKKPFGTKVRSGELCPESGIWRSVTTPSKSTSIAQGRTMPQYRARNIHWKLIRYS